jgi:hypothetical protein
VAGLRPPSLNPLDKTMNHDFEARVSDVKSRAHGHWTGILRSLGVDEDILKGKNLPCPIDGCGGTDRFQYTDKFGEGNYHCRSCGAGWRTEARARGTRRAVQ